MASHSLISAFTDKNDKNVAISNISPINCVSFSNDGKKLLACNDEGKIYCWNYETVGKNNNLLSKLQISEMGVISIACNLNKIIIKK